MKKTPDLTSIQENSEGSETRWYELDRFVPYRDLVFVLGFLIVAVGVGMLSIPVGLIAVGLGLILVSWLMSR